MKRAFKTIIECFNPGIYNIGSKILAIRLIGNGIKAEPLIYCGYDIHFLLQKNYTFVLTKSNGRK